MSMELDIESLKHGQELVKRGFARMQKGGVIMDVVNAEQADIAEKAGAVAVMALERVPSDIRADGGVARMSNPNMITEIVECTSIPVMAKCRIGHTAEAKVLEALGVDMIAPEGYGEIVGGGQREDNIEILIETIRHHDLPLKPFEWYLDLRKYGSVPHSGFGLGLERFVAWVCGTKHIRETIPFPRTMARLEP